MKLTKSAASVGHLTLYAHRLQAWDALRRSGLGLRSSDCTRAIGA